MSSTSKHKISSPIEYKAVQPNDIFLIYGEMDALPTFEPNYQGKNTASKQELFPKNVPNQNKRFIPAETLKNQATIQ